MVAKKRGVSKPKPKLKTMIALERAETILTHGTTKERPKQWGRWLRRYDFIPRKYIAFFIFGALATLLKNDNARSAIFTVLATYFPRAKKSLGTAGWGIKAYVDHTQGEKLDLVRDIKSFPAYYATHRAKAALGDPEAVLLENATKSLASSLSQLTYDITKLTWSQCSKVVMTSARRLITNEGMLKLVDMSFLSPAFGEQSKAYIPSESNPMSEDLKHQARQFWLIMLCDAEATDKHNQALPNHGGATGANVKRALVKMKAILASLK